MLITYSNNLNKEPDPAVLSLRERRDRTDEYSTILILTQKETLIHTFLSFKWKLIIQYTSNPAHSLIHSSVRIMLLYPIWSLSPGSGLVYIHLGEIKVVPVKTDSVVLLNTLNWKKILNNDTI